MDMRKGSDFDAVVIGAGHNGLVCAAYLARHGVRTLLLEARTDVGGTATSESFAGATVSICNCDHLTFRTTPISDELDLASHGLRYVDIEPAQLNGHWDSDTYWSLHHDVDETLESLGRSVPADVAGYRRFARDAVPVARLITEAANNPPTRASLLGRTAWRGGRGLATMLGWSRRSALDVLRSYFSDERVYGPALVEGPVLWGLSPDTPGTGLAAIAFALRHVTPVGRPVGGSGALPRALLSAFTASGGEVRMSTRVVSIDCVGGGVRSVTTHDGTVIHAPIVVSACDPRRTFVEWLADPPAGAAALVSKWASMPRQGGYESKMDVVLDTAPVLAGMQETPASTIVLSPTVEEMRRGAAGLADGWVMDRPAMLANFPAYADPGLAPAGRHILSLEALFTPYALPGGWQASTLPDQWLSRLAGRMQPGFLGSVVAQRTVTPDLYESEFHLPMGHATSFPGGPLSAFMGVDRELSRYETPVKGLYLTGAATFPGAGVWGASGRNAALTVIKRL
ncbi:MAG: phytoene desaturase family protein [Actinomycetota bacterium]